MTKTNSIFVAVGLLFSGYVIGEAVDFLTGWGATRRFRNTCDKYAGIYIRPKGYWIRGNGKLA